MIRLPGNVRFGALVISVVLAGLALRLAWGLHGTETFGLGFDAQAQVEKDGMCVSGDSIMGLLMLTAPRGSQITVTTSGPDALPLADALEALVADYFGEGM